MTGESKFDKACQNNIPAFWAQGTAHTNRVADLAKAAGAEMPNSPPFSPYQKPQALRGDFKVSNFSFISEPCTNLPSLWWQEAAPEGASWAWEYLPSHAENTCIKRCA